MLFRSRKLDQLAGEMSGLTCRGGFSSSQLRVFKLVQNHFSSGQTLRLFVNARGGTGKTHLLNAILASARTLDATKITPALAVASSGIAATELLGGRTFHSRFRAPLVVDETLTLDIPVQSALAQLIKLSRLIVWDEAPMANRFLLEALDRSLRDIMEIDNPFGGKNIILAGDFRFVNSKAWLSHFLLFCYFRQILPVIKNGSRSQIIESCIKCSPLWKCFTVESLTENIRLISAKNFESALRYDDWLLKLGNGEAPSDVLAELPSRNVRIIKKEHRHAFMQEAVHWVYGDAFRVSFFLSSIKTVVIFCDCRKLTCLRKVAFCVLQMQFVGNSTKSAVRK